MVNAALGLTDAAAAYRIVGRSPSGTVADLDAAVGAFMRAIDNLDRAVQNLAFHVSGPRSGTLAAVRVALEGAYTQLREALICSAVDFRQPRSSQQVRAMRERYPVLPHRLAQGGPVNAVVRLASDGFPPQLRPGGGRPAAAGSCPAYGIPPSEAGIRRTDEIGTAEISLDKGENPR